MLDLSCLCGEVRLVLSKRPEFINACNCTLCAATGAYWGYYHPSEVTVSGEPRGYCRQDKADASADVRFCGNCGTTTHFNLTPAAIERFGNTLIGVNMRLADERDCAGIELRFPDGRAWPGEGEFGYVRDSIVIGQG